MVKTIQQLDLFALLYGIIIVEVVRKCQTFLDFGVHKHPFDMASVGESAR
jgi:hypothetical protein